MRDDVVLSEAWKISRKIILYFRISAHQVRLQLADCRKVHSHVVGGNCCCCCSSQESEITKELASCTRIILIIGTCNPPFEVSSLHVYEFVLLTSETDGCRTPPIALWISDVISKKAM